MYTIAPRRPLIWTRCALWKRLGTVSTRGLRKDATLFDEIIIDVNTMYFERNGGYEYAKKFYEEAYHFLEKKFGSEYVVAAVMHADEINKAATSDLGKDVYHYHLHAVVIPVVDKDILWSKRCQGPGAARYGSGNYSSSEPFQEMGIKYPAER